MKKVIFTIMLLFVFPMISLAYSINTVGMSNEVATLLKTLEESWPMGIDDGRIEVIRQAALMINKGTVYGGHTGICYTGTPPSLDCSAYVSLAFHRAGVTEVGCDWYTGSYSASASFSNISESDLRPGDVGLNNDTMSTDNHIGIYIGYLDGQNIWLHSSTVNGVSGPQIRRGNGNFRVFKRYNKWNEIFVGSSSGNSGIGGELGGSLEDPYVDFKLNTSDDFTCETIFYKVKNGEKQEKTLKKILDGIFRLIMISAPIIAIILSIIDYIKVISNSNSDGLKKANARMFKRIAISLIIIFIPFILELLFNIFGLYDLSNCGIS